MKEAKGNMWRADVDAFVITTNGFVKKNGRAVMGRGCAKEAAEFWPKLPKLLGDALIKNGNTVHFFAFGPLDDCRPLFTFPVKHNWWEKADLELIKRSCQELIISVEGLFGDQKLDIAMPRPGCGNGQLDWNIVKPICEKYLDDRFIVYNY